MVLKVTRNAACPAAWPAAQPKNGLERYLTFEPNHILVTLRWDDEYSTGHKNVCRISFFKGIQVDSFQTQIQIMTESIKTNRVFLRKMFEMEFKFIKFSSIRSKALGVGISERTKRLVAQSTAYALLNQQG